MTRSIISTMSSFTMSSFAIPSSRVPGLILAGALLLGAGGCTNPKTPAGHEGYVYHVPIVVGEAQYRESLEGPASTGASWRLYVINIDMRMRMSMLITYSRQEAPVDAGPSRDSRYCASPTTMGTW